MSLIAAPTSQAPRANRSSRPVSFDPQGELRAGLARLGAGDLAGGREILERVLRTRPLDAHLMRVLGVACFNLGDFEAAGAHFRQALQIEPNHVETLCNLAKVGTRQPDSSEALECLELALRLAPSDPDAHLTLAALQIQQGRHGDALGHFVQVLQSNPSRREAWCGAAAACTALGKTEDAINFYDMSLKILPDDPEVLNNRASLRVKLGDHLGALEDFERLVQAHPGFAKAWNNRGVSLEEIGRIDEALVCFERAAELDPGFADAHSNRAKTLMRMQRMDEGLKAAETALRLDASHQDGALNLAMGLLMVGRLQEGLELYERRWERPGMPLVASADRMWVGQCDIRGKTLLIQAEQGLGDSIQFSRYALMAREAGARPVLLVPPPLVTLLRSLHPDIPVLTEGDASPSFHMFTPMISLMRAFRTEVDSIPAYAAYLRPDTDRVAHWRRRLGPSDRLRVGLVWSGGFRKELPSVWSVNRRRNIALERLARLNVPGVEFFSLQKGEEGEEQLRRVRDCGWSGPDIVDHTSDLHDFAETAALIDCLDLVIAVDTSTAHVAAAIGKPVWMLNRFDTCWRWLLGREDTPWYPTMRLYRQDAEDAWEPVVERVRDDLQALVARRQAAE